ncbi:unnamed protein product [Prorocentrum cordatum]|uniref:Uncharacterized protein n=1 Tax=Prorocentrum cordatum TaxID=2364126 RepID=A0ABN9VXK4_9DINO|nr:unnamed protein product [Polarella glacialis]
MAKLRPHNWTYSGGMSVRILNPMTNSLVLANSTMKHRFAWSTVAADASGQVMLVKLFGSEGLSQPCPNICEVTFTPNLPPEVATYFLEVLPGIGVWTELVLYVSGAGLLLVMVSNSYNSKSNSKSPSTV